MGLGFERVPTGGELQSAPPRQRLSGSGWWRQAPPHPLFSLQAPCPPPLSSQDPALLCRPGPSFHCPRRRSWCPAGLALARLRTAARPGMREEGKRAREVGRGGFKAALPRQITYPSSCVSSSPALPRALPLLTRLKRPPLDSNKHIFKINRSSFCSSSFFHELSYYHPSN